MGVIQEKLYPSVKPAVETTSYGAQYVKVNDDDAVPEMMIGDPLEPVVDLDKLESASSEEETEAIGPAVDEAPEESGEAAAEEPAVEKKKAGRPRKSNKKTGK